MIAFVTFILYTLIFPYTKSQKVCEYFQDVDVTKVYDIFSPGYDRYYPMNSTCKWSAEAPIGYNLFLDCFNVEMPVSNNCMGDRIELSERGRFDLKDARRFCGKGEFTFLTPTNVLAMRYIATSRSPGGRFLCNLQAITDFCQCGRKNDLRIVGGIASRTNEFRMMAALVETSDSKSIFCGATIISKRHCLSAGHCLVGRRIIDLAILVGDDDIDTGTDTPFSALYRILQVILHPKYRQNKADNDIAIVKVDQDFEFNPGVNLVCLPFKYQEHSFSEEKVTAVGWGTLEFSGPKSNKLMKVQLDVINNTQCKTRGMNITDNHLCTYTKGKDTCQFDSGGPLLYEDQINFRMYLIGIINHGISCASKYPTVNIRITKYLDWIQDNTENIMYCNK